MKPVYVFMCVKYVAHTGISVSQLSIKDSALIVSPICEAAFDKKKICACVCVSILYVGLQYVTVWMYSMCALVIEYVCVCTYK